MTVDPPPPHHASGRPRDALAQPSAFPTPRARGGSRRRTPEPGCAPCDLPVPGGGRSVDAMEVRRSPDTARRRTSIRSKRVDPAGGHGGRHDRHRRRGQRVRAVRQPGGRDRGRPRESRPATTELDQAHWAPTSRWATSTVTMQTQWITAEGDDFAARSHRSGGDRHRRARRRGPLRPARDARATSRSTAASRRTSSRSRSRAPSTRTASRA